MTQVREKFASQIDSELLAELRRLAREEGRQIQAVLEEALLDLLEKRRHAKPRRHIMVHYQSSHETFAELYKKLAE
jgi:mRNA-degrading endonuclease RelE of RelBE toxin-antitoxin system